MTMTKGATIQLRINATTKEKAASVFKKYGLTLTDGIRLYLERVATMNEIPFSLNIPNSDKDTPKQGAKAPCWTSG
jgi:DNA-damage-inducible protein J